MMSIEKETTVAGRVYSEGTINGTNVVLVFSRWGKVASASTTTTLINKFDIDFVLFTGVAGAVSEDLNIGDIVIGSSLYQHDMDARPFFDQFQIPLTPTIFFEPKKMDIEKAQEAAQRFIDGIDGVFSNELLRKYSIFKPKVRSGIIASGDQFISDAKSHPNLSLSIKGKKTLAAEMEGAAVAQICEDHDMPFIVIRTISDKADHSAAIDFQAFIKDVASKYSSGVVSNYIASFQ
jgi:adenosylhomocysteine nucleosidase